MVLASWSVFMFLTLASRYDNEFVNVFLGRAALVRGIECSVFLSEKAIVVMGSDLKPRRCSFPTSCPR